MCVVVYMKMRDKIYNKLNKKKPTRKVLNAAFGEMKAQKEARKRKPVFKWVLSGAVSILVIVVSIFVAVNMFPSGKLNEGKDYSGSHGPTYNPPASPPPEYDSENQEGAKLEIGFDYKKIDALDDGEWYQYEEDVIIKIYKENLSYNGTGEVVFLEGLGTSGRKIANGSTTEVYFQYEQKDYLLSVDSIEQEVINIILENLKKK